MKIFCMRKLYILLVLLFISQVLFAQSLNDAKKFINFIDENDLNRHLSIIASDEYEGRETGKPGQKLAAEYLRNEFQEIGLPQLSAEGYFQNYHLIEKVLGKRLLEVNQTAFEIAEDFFPVKDQDVIDILSNDIYFVGYGINDAKYNSFAGIDVKDKVILVMAGEPEQNGNYIITGTSEKSLWSNNNKKISELKKLNPSLIIMVDPNYKKSVKFYKHRIESSGLKLAYKQKKGADIPVITVSEKLADALLAPNKKSISKISPKLQSAKIAQKSLKLKSTLKVNIEFISQDVFSENVLAYVPGSEKPEEYIFITAHYDHIGASNGEVYNGADDDGSGTVALLEIAQAFMEAKKAGMGPKRSIVFMAVSGEEKGLLGSEYYTDHPIVTLDQTVANLNIDMIGRIDDAHKDDTNYVYVIGADKLSSELHAINEKANEIAKLKLDYKYNDPKDPNMFYYRSDHYNFAKNNIPIIFYFNGVHEDYHKAGDEVSKIHFPMLAKRTQLVYLTAWELANRDNRIIVDKANDFPTK
jgi:hypothetical protein